MTFKHFSAVNTLNGKFEYCVRKWRFSLTKISLPVHSVYAAIKTLADLNPFASYLEPNSKGTTKSSSTSVTLLTNSLNSRNASGDKFLLTSSNIVRGIRILCFSILSIRVSKSWLDFSDSLRGPKAYIYIHWNQ